MTRPEVIRHPDVIRARMCTGKYRFTTRSEAARVARRQRRLGVRRLTAYACLFCDFWHVGHMPRRGRPDRVLPDGFEP